MKYLIIISLAFCLSTLQAQEYFRNMPSAELLGQVTPEKFPKADAVIIVKEQSISMKNETIWYLNYEIEGYSIITTRCMIVKLLNEAAVSRYGSFEYSYWEDYGDEFPAGFMARARVLKASGALEELPEKEIKKIVSLTDHNGKTRKRKILFKIPNLAPGDVVQIEYQHNEPLSSVGSGVIFYNDVDPVLFSNSYLTMPSEYEMDIASFPEEKVGQPKIEQISKDYGSGKTYFWSVRNLNSVPKEAYGQPFEESALMTGFVIKSIHGKNIDTWNSWSKYYFDHYIDRSSIDSDNLDSLKLPEKPEKIDSKLINDVYSSLKRFFNISSRSTIVPKKSVDEIFKERDANPTDVAFVMYRILQEWKVESRVVLIRDQRKGAYEKEVVTSAWFDRLGVEATIDGKEQLFDFDQSTANAYSTPWFLNGIELCVINPTDTFFTFKNYTFNSGPGNNILSENHRMTINDDLSVTDTLHTNHTGSFADNLRYKLYEQNRRSVKEHFRSLFGTPLFSKIDTVVTNDLFEESNTEVSITGLSTVKAEPVDTFLVVRPKETVFTLLHDKLLAPSRKGPIFFDSPFKLEFTCKVAYPRGYVLKGGEIESNLTGPMGGKFTYTVNKGRTDCLVTCTLLMPAQKLPAASYPELLKFFEGAIKSAGRDLIFKKR